MAGLTSSASPLDAARSLLGGDPPIRPDTVEQAPDAKGAYLLVLELGEPLPFQRGPTVHVFEPGWYVYAGSAYGPGGIRARVRRHFRRGKKLHWHIDQLTGAADSICALSLRDGSECAIVSELSCSPAFMPSLAGFGSSDCQICPTHLLEWRG